MKFNFKKFGEAVKFKRTAGITGHDKPYSQKELAEFLNLDHTAISRVENGKGLTVENILVLSKWSNLDLYDFVEEN